MKLSFSFKEISSRALPSLSTRKDICPFLVLRVSSRCLIYKVHAASRRVFILPHSLWLVKYFFQPFSRFSFVLGIRVSHELLHSTMSFSPCQVPFSNFFERYQPLGHANSFSLADPKAIVKHFFQPSEFFFSSSACFCASRKALS